MSIPASPRPRAFLRLCPPDVFGLTAHGEFPDEDDAIAAELWLHVVLDGYPSVNNMMEELDITASNRNRLYAWKRGELTDEPVARFVYMLRRALGRLAEVPLPLPEIKGESPEDVRRRFRWARLHYYEDYTAQMAEAMGITRSYLAHWFADPKRGLTERMVDGMVQAGFRREWVVSGEGPVRRV